MLNVIYKNMQKSYRKVSKNMRKHTYKTCREIFWENMYKYMETYVEKQDSLNIFYTAIDLLGWQK